MFVGNQGMFAVCIAQRSIKFSYAFILIVFYIFSSYFQNKRDLIVEELVKTEQTYVDTLHMLVEVSIDTSRITS